MHGDIILLITLSIKEHQLDMNQLRHQLGTNHLHRLQLILEHSDQRYVTLFSRSMFYMVFLLFFNTCLSTVIDLESLG